MTAPRFLRAVVDTPFEIASVRPGLAERVRDIVDVSRVLPDRVRPPLPTPAPAPPPVAPAPPVAPVGGTPFDGLPTPSPGDRIRAEDFRRITQCLQLVQQATVLSSTLFGRTLGEARTALQAQGWQLDRVLSVFGQDVAAGGAHEDRRVVQVVPASLGLNRVHLVVTEAVATQRLAPNLVGLSHAEAMERLRAAVGEVTMQDVAVSAPALGGLTLGDAVSAVSAPTR